MCVLVLRYSTKVNHKILRNPFLFLCIYCFFLFLMYILAFSTCFVLFFFMKIIADHFSTIIRQNQLIKSDFSFFLRKNNNVWNHELYDKTLLSTGNVHKITKLSQFRVDMRSWKGVWLRNGTRGYRKFGLKRCARLQRKTSWKRRGEIYSRCGLIAQNV